MDPPLRSDKRIKIPAAIQKCNQQRENHQDRTNDNADDIHFGKLPSRIPSAFRILSKTAKFHSVGNGLDPFHRGQDQRN